MHHRFDHNVDFQPQRTHVQVKVDPEDGTFRYRYPLQDEWHQRILIPCRSTTFFAIFRLHTEGAAFATHPVQWSDPSTARPIPDPPNIRTLRLDDATMSLNMVNSGNPMRELRTNHFQLVVAIGGTYFTSPDPTIIEQQTPPSGGGG